MANMSHSEIDSVVQYLAKAAEAAKGLDARSQNLCFALNIACSEAGRVAKAMRKTTAAQKPEKAAKKPEKAEKAEKAARALTATKKPSKTQGQSQSRRKTAAINGAVAH
jgi:hypothetical protein